MRTLSVLALLVSAQAFACPDLTGSYVCTYQDGSRETVSISQSEQKGVTVYELNGSTIPADNQTYPIPDDDTLKGGTFRAWCDSADPTLLQTQLTGQYYSQGSYYGDLVLNTSFSRAGADLKQSTQGTIKNSGGEAPLNSELTCLRR